MANVSHSKTERRLFLLLVCIEFVGAAILAIIHYIPAQWDTLQYFQLQYYFLNGAVTSGQVPQWIPFLTHGVIANWWYALQATILQSALMQFSPLLRHCNLLYCFHAGIFIDKMLLLCGTWLLCRRLSLSVIATFVASLCAVGSVVWMDQIYWDLHLYYALPLLLYLGHRFLDTGRWRYFIAAGNLLAVQTWGNLPYFIPVITLLIAVYFTADFLLNRARIIPILRRLRWRWAVPALAIVAVPLWLSYFFLTIGTSQIANFSEERLPDGSVPLDTFLKYGGNLDLDKWADLTLGAAPAGDFTLYIGMIAAPLAFVGLFAAGKKRGALLALLVLLIFFSMGTPVSVLAYFTWPGMRFFRHLTLLCTIVKLILCILAGVGLDYLLPQDETFSPRALGRVLGGLMLAWSALLFAGLYQQYLFRLMVVDIQVKPPLWPDIAMVHPDVIQNVMVRAAIYSLMAGIILIFIGMRFRPKLCKILLVLLLLADIYQFQWTQTILRGTRLSGERASLTLPTELPYSPRRASQIADDSERVRLYGPVARQQESYYWTTDAFLFFDEAGNKHRTDFWMQPFDRMIRAFLGQDIGDQLLPAQHKIAYGGLIFPTSSSAQRVAGITADKIQFFSAAWSISSPRQMAKLLADSKFKGDTLYIDTPAKDSRPWNLSLDADERLPLKYNVTNFNSNNIEVTVDNTTGAPCWMMYSDVWHPFWHATVNDHDVPILCADLAYKAVPLDPGPNRVHFEFYSLAIDAVGKFQRLNAALWLGIILWLIYIISRRGTA